MSQISARVQSLTLIVLAVALLGVFPVRASDQAAIPQSRSTATQLRSQAKVLELMGQLPLGFEPNDGQVDGRVKFLSRGPGYDVFLTDSGAVLSIKKVSAKKHASANTSDVLRIHPEPAVSKSVLQMQLLGANTKATASGLDRQPGTTNYFVGKD